MSIRLLARTFAGLSLCAAALSASAYSNLVVFGDSLSDTGNNALVLNGYFDSLNLPVPAVNIVDNSTHTPIPSSFGTYSNGLVWTQYLAQSLGLPLAPSLAGGTNYAFGGAQTGVDGADLPGLDGFPYSMRTQLGSYFATTNHLADPNALYIVAGGGNNIRVALEAIAAGADESTTIAAAISGYATDMAGLVGDLKQAGAQHVLVLNTPNYGLTPWMTHIGRSAEATALSFAMDTALDGALAGSGAITFDMFGFLTQTINAGAASGFSNWTQACGAAVNACDETTSLFWDGVHPTTLAHQQLAAAVLATAVPEPDVAAMLSLGIVVVTLGARRRAAAQQR